MVWKCVQCAEKRLSTRSLFPFFMRTMKSVWWAREICAMHCSNYKRTYKVVCNNCACSLLLYVFSPDEYMPASTAYWWCALLEWNFCAWARFFPARRNFVYNSLKKHRISSMSGYKASSAAINWNACAQGQLRGTLTTLVFFRVKLLARRIWEVQNLFFPLFCTIGFSSTDCWL